MKSEGLIKQVGISTPEHDQNCVIQLMRDGMVDVLQVIYNIFEQEPAAQLFPVAMETGTGIIVRVAFDEGVLTGKYKGNETFGPDDFRSNYFAGDRLERGVRRTETIKKEFKESGYSMPELALKFALIARGCIHRNSWNPEPATGPSEHGRVGAARTYRKDDASASRT